MSPLFTAAETTILLVPSNEAVSFTVKNLVSIDDFSIDNPQQLVTRNSVELRELYDLACIRLFPLVLELSKGTRLYTTHVRRV